MFSTRFEISFDANIWPESWYQYHTKPNVTKMTPHIAYIRDKMADIVDVDSDTIILKLKDIANNLSQPAKNSITKQPGKW